MKRTGLTVSIIIVAISLVTVVAGFASDDNSLATDTKETNTKKYDLVEVAAHNTIEDCWTVIDAKVYDVTDYLVSHPGGSDTLQQACGIDATEEFNDRLGGGPHSAFAKNILQRYQIGTLAR